MSANDDGSIVGFAEDAGVAGTPGDYLDAGGGVSGEEESCVFCWGLVMRCFIWSESAGRDGDRQSWVGDVPLQSVESARQFAMFDVYTA